MLLIIIVQTLQYFSSGFCSTTRHVFNAIKSLYRTVYPLLQLKRCWCIAFSSVVVYWRSRENRYCFFLFIAHGRCYLLLFFFFLWLAVTKDPELVLFTRTREEQSFSVCNIYERTKCLLDSIVSLSCALTTDLLARYIYIYRTAVVD